MNSKRAPRKQAATPSSLPVPRIRAMRSDDIADQPEAVETSVTRPRRNRKPKFVF